MEKVIQQKTQQMKKTTSGEKKSINQMLNETMEAEGLRKRFDELLGKRTAQFVGSMVTLINADINLQQAFLQAPITVIQACLKAASYDLPIDPGLGFAYIVPFKNKKKDENGNVSYRMEATFIPGWKGMHQLAMRTGAYKTINVTDVREGELKKYNRLTEEIEIEFIDDEDVRDATPIIGYLGYYRLINGAEKIVYMTKKQIENHERKFRKGQYMSRGWRDDFDAMALKTVYRRLIGKWGVMSIEYQTREEAQQLADVMAADNEFEGKLLDNSEDASIIDTDPATGEVIKTEDGNAQQN